MPYRLNPAWWSAKLGATVVGWMLVVVTAALIALTIYGLNTRTNVQDQVIREIASDNVADATWKGATRALEVHRAEKEAEVEEVLANEPEWADAPLPESVAEQLRDPNRKAK